MRVSRRTITDHSHEDDGLNLRPALMILTCCFRVVVVVKSRSALEASRASQELWRPAGVKEQVAAMAAGRELRAPHSVAAMQGAAFDDWSRR